jgi:glycosyltransferase involved in cell wall biosynthesis
MTSTFYPPYSIGGDANHVKYLAEELANIGHEVHVFYNRDAYAVKRRNLPQMVKSQDIFIHEFKSNSNLSPYAAYLFGNSPAISKTFNALVKQIRPNIIHHHNISLLGYGILKSYGTCANIYTAHDFWLVCPQNNLLKNGNKECNVPSCFTCSLKRKKPPQLWRYYHNFKNVVDNIDLIIAPCEYLQRRIAQEINVRSVMMRNFAPMPPIHISTASYCDYFLFVGALEEHKGIMNLLEVFRKSQHKIGAKLLIVGSGSLRNSIMHFIRQYSLDNLVIFLGSVPKEELYSLYQNAYALVVPSIWPENSPLVIMEALSVGTPAIVSNMGGLCEIMRKVDGRFIFNNLDELENILINFPKNNIDKKNVASIYSENFSPKVYIDRYIKYIEALQNRN